MFRLLGVFTVLITISFVKISLAHSESWDLGYTSASPEVEEIPESISDERISERDELSEEVKANIAEVSDQEKAPVRSNRSILKISTQKNTFGVETVEKPGLKLFLSPVAGLTSITGNGTVNVNPQYSFGGRVGLLISDNMMIEGGFTHSVINTSTPVGLAGFQNTSQSVDVFALKQNVADVGAKFFFLGRESRFRPFVGGAFAYGNSTLNYTSTYASMMGLTDDYSIKQFQGAGQVGAEIAITRGIVATAAFKFNGILSSSTQSIKNEATATGLEANKVQAGDSLSRSASYAGTVGVGMYF